MGTGIYKKLLKAKEGFGVITKDKMNPFFKKNYADLGSVLEAVEPSLVANGLMLTQPAKNGFVYSVITDAESGESIESYLELPSSEEPQKIGAAATYLRRYTLLGLLALSVEDNDGNPVQNQPPRLTPSNTGVPQQQQVKTTPEQAAVQALKATPQPVKVNQTAKPTVAGGGDVIPFGKYRDKAVADAAMDPEFIGWCSYLIEKSDGKPSEQRTFDQATRWKTWAVSNGPHAEQDRLPF